MNQNLDKVEDIIKLVKAELAQITNVPLKNALTEFLVSPHQQKRVWEYSLDKEQLPCWIVADFKEHELALAYSQFGHGSYGDHWGIVYLADLYFGRDDSWFRFLEDAFINSGRYDGPVPDDYEIR
jgi:hypothetical protein